MKTITEIKRSANLEIFNVIIDKYKFDNTEIENNYNMGLITMTERLTQMQGIINKALKDIKANNIDETDIYK